MVIGICVVFVQPATLGTLSARLIRHFIRCLGGGPNSTALSWKPPAPSLFVALGHVHKRRG